MRCFAWATVPLFALTFAFAQDIDSVKVDSAHHTVVYENDQVRVVHWVIPVGDKTLNHSHPNSLNINLTDYNGRVTPPEGKIFEVHDKAGSASWRPALIHVVENLGSRPMEGIIVEPKKPASARPAGSGDPVVIDPEHQTVAFENEQIRVIRESRLGGKTPMHGHPDNVQVMLTDARWNVTTADGRTALVIGKAGEVRWRLATQHIAEALGDNPIEQIVVEMKGASKVNAPTALNPLVEPSGTQVPLNCEVCARVGEIQRCQTIKASSSEEAASLAMHQLCPEGAGCNSKIRAICK